MIKCGRGAKTDHTIDSGRRDYAIRLGMGRALAFVEAVAAKKWDRFAETQRGRSLVAASGLPDLKARP